MGSRLALLRPLLAGLAILLVLYLGFALVLLHRTPASGTAAAPRRPAAGSPAMRAATPDMAVDPSAGPAPEGAINPVPFGAIPILLQPELGGQGPHHLIRGRSCLPYVSLTFDGGAHAADLPRILAILDDRQVSATFFLTGEFLRRHPGLTRQLTRTGHEVGSHLFDHVHLTTWETNGRQDLAPGVTREYFHSLLRRNEEAYLQLTGRAMQKLWRAPFGETNPTLDGWAAELGYIHVAWTRDFSGTPSMDSLDWVADPAAPRYLTAAQIRDRLLGFDGGTPGGANGAIILMHTGTLRRSEYPWTVLGDVVDGLRARGYTFVPASRLVRESLRTSPGPAESVAARH